MLGEGTSARLIKFYTPVLVAEIEEKNRSERGGREEMRDGGKEVEQERKKEREEKKKKKQSSMPLVNPLQRGLRC